jgi:hypothetical protein
MTRIISISTLPDELLIIIFTDIPGQCELPNEHKSLLPLQTVCQRWNVRLSVTRHDAALSDARHRVQALLKPILYRKLGIDTDLEPDDVLLLAASLARGRKDHSRDWSSHVRELIIWPHSEHLAEVKFILLCLERVQRLGIIYGGADRIQTPLLDACSHACSVSLSHLNLVGPETRAYAYIGRFRNLTSLRILNDVIEEPIPDGLASWDLPTLQFLAWEEPPSTYDLPEHALHAVRFLSRCSFPQLRTAVILIEVGEKDGPKHICHFLERHPTIDELLLRLAPGAYDKVLPHIRARRLSLRHCTEVEPCLLHHLSLTVQCLGLPVYLFDSALDAPDPQVNTADRMMPITETMKALLLQPRGVVQIDLSSAERQVLEFDCDLTPLDFRCVASSCARQDTTDETPAVATQTS